MYNQIFMNYFCLHWQIQFFQLELNSLTIQETIMNYLVYHPIPTRRTDNPISVFDKTNIFIPSFRAQKYFKRNLAAFYANSFIYLRNQSRVPARLAS